MPILRAAARSAISSIRFFILIEKIEIAAGQSDPSVRLDWERAALMGRWRARG
jgi:hypothetical protein